MEPTQSGTPASESVQEAERAEEERRARRRRLLKGLVAAGAAASPLLVTLRNGARAAAASSYTCIVHNPAPVDGARCTVGSDPNNEWKHQAETAFTPAYDLSGAGAGAASGTDYCVIYVDANGVVAGANDGCVNCYGGSAGPNNHPANGFYALTDSCWNSFL